MTLVVVVVVTHIWNPTDDDEVPYHYSSSAAENAIKIDEFDR